MNRYENGSDWHQPLVILVAVVLLGGVVLGLMGTQVSHILSTVGSSVTTNGDVYNDAGQVDDPASDGSDGDQSGGDESVGGQAGSSGPSSAVIANLGTAARPDLLIIKTGSIAIQALDVDAALADATNRMVALGGYASASDRTGDGDDAQASTTYRVPADRWEAALLAARAVGEKVLDERSATEDVTGQVVDLEARIRNLETTEAALQAIMDRATAIKDVLEVQEQLTTIRGEIEQLASHSADLRERAAMSTLTVTISRKPQPVVAKQEARFDAGSEAEAATARLVSILQDLAAAGIWFGIVWLPILAALAMIGAAGILVARRIRRVVRVGPPAVTAPGSEA